MNKKSFLLYALSSLFWFSIIFAFESADLIVALDSSGDFTTIQAAIDAAPSNATEHYVILIKNGTYHEKLFIEKSNIALVGENRDSTIIVTAELRSIWRETNPSDWGAATINISDGASDLVFANLSIINNFADVYPDHPNKHDHTMTIRGGGDRVIIICCNIIATGGDTCSLWGHGYYYHKDCYFEGYVDYVCPRGWCYITDCDFYGYNTGASIWHDGRENPDEKLVIRNSIFDGIVNFGLGRYHRDSQFYLLDCFLSENVNDNGGIFKAGSDPIQWGHRVYYYNTHRENGDYDWHEDNLWEAVNSPTPEEITALWTFRNQWDPEKTIPSVLLNSYLPSPYNGKVKVDLNPQLSWIPGRNTISHNIYFGQTNPPPYQVNLTDSLYEPGPLNYNTNYYWRVDQVTEEGVVEGQVWHFRTETNQIPVKATNPFPENNAINVPVPVKKLFWDMDVSVVDTAKVYMGISLDSLQLVSTYTIAGFDPGYLVMGTTYYWRVDVINKIGAVHGDLWQFTMEESIYQTADYYQDPGSDGIVCLEAENYTKNEPIGDHQWTFITDVAGYSGEGAMRALPDVGTFLLVDYSEKSARLDYAVNFIKAGTHYLWVRAYSRDSNDNYLHIGLNGEEVTDAYKIGNFQDLYQWEWLNTEVTATEDIRKLEIQALGIQVINLWFGKDGATVDKILLTTNPDYIPSGLGPNQTAGINRPEKTNIPLEFHLYQNYPNPFNSSTVIDYTIAQSCHVKLNIYDILGRKVSTLVSVKQKPGNYTEYWYALNNRYGNLASGVYIAELQAGRYTHKVKLLYIK